MWFSSAFARACDTAAEVGLRVALEFLPPNNIPDAGVALDLDGNRRPIDAPGVGAEGAGDLFDRGAIGAIEKVEIGDDVTYDYAITNTAAPSL